LNQEKDVGQREELLQLFPNNMVNTYGDGDWPSWELDSTQTFSVNWAYLRLNDGGIRRTFMKVIWNN